MEELTKCLPASAHSDRLDLARFAGWLGALSQFRRQVFVKAAAPGSDDMHNSRSVVGLLPAATAAFCPQERFPFLYLERRVLSSSFWVLRGSRRRRGRLKMTRLPVEAISSYSAKKPTKLTTPNTCLAGGLASKVSLGTWLLQTSLSTFRDGVGMTGNKVYTYLRETS